MENTKSFNKTNYNVKINDNSLIDVKSNVFGGLIYINSKTGEETIWENNGDIQQMTMADLRAMKANQVSFFVNQWIIILGSEDEGIKPFDVYKALNVTKYYQNIVEPSNFYQINKWTVEQIPEKVKLLSEGARKNLVVALNNYIENGELDSIKKIKAFEEALGCELMELK